MLDIFGILFSAIIIFLVIFRAIREDATLPWFTAPKPSDSSGLALRSPQQGVRPEPRQTGWRR